MGGQFNCPHCGGKLELKAVQQRPIEKTLRARIQPSTQTLAMTTWARNDEAGQFEPQEGSAPTAQPFPIPGTYRESEERTPIHAPSLSAQWATPTAKALTVWIGTSTLSFAVLAGYASVPRPGLAAFVIGGIPGAVQWMRDQEYFRNALYQVKNFTEEFLQQDLDGGGSEGEPEPSRPDPGMVIINGRQVPQESEASKKRRALVALAELIWKRQNSDPPLNTGVKELYGDRLPGGYKINYKLHKELGTCMVKGGYAQTRKVGKNETWDFLPDVQLEELAPAIGTWSDD